ncbi:2-polyprenyl-6-methoxyphenol hydroxylase [Paracidovorax valerianellae]|uniref:2-polyprenyl-6-methoxyphenol hydroxylase n=2 Tax=Paracidovorax valerianellae TaxID=187868 RepID=A0A1G7AZC7_9BURK|nr:FAD-dependent monooxygenase [Paracidovorax valerianellae]SDE20121.1 2-polyprenyl-6-methoxyphenol hydroxylase [Paracidovorax valerianellae]
MSNLQNLPDRTTEVLIVGAGPVGLTLCLALQRLEIRSILVDQHAAGLNTSRAAVIHARTLEVLEPCGVVPALLQKGCKTIQFRVRDQERILLDIGFSELPSAYPFALMCPQNETEGILESRLQAVGAEVVRPARLLSAVSAQDEVHAELQWPTGGTQRIRAQWIVGCDGARSTVRQSAGIAFEGGDYEEAFVLADVRMDWPLPREEVTLFFAAQGLMVVAPLPGGPGEAEDRYRIVATVAHSAAAPSLADVQALLDERSAHRRPARVAQMSWSSSFHLQHRVAAQVMKGRTLLCGDAAHVHSPAGGQGMNTGIQDAAALAEPLLQALRHGDRQGLQAWAARRHAIAKDIVSTTDAMTRVATASSPLARVARNAALGWLGHMPFVQKKIAMRLAELDQ